MTKQMAKREPIAWLPDDHYVYADDALNLTRREWVRIAATSLFMVFAVAAIMFALSVVQ